MFAEAENRYVTSGYQAAVDYLQQSLTDYEDDEIHEKIQYYESLKPVNLLAENYIEGDLDKYLVDYGLQSLLIT